MLSAAVTQDTVRLVRHGVRKLLDAVAAVDGRRGAALDRALEFDYARPRDWPRLASNARAGAREVRAICADRVTSRSVV
jgi:hypothetical protein